MAFGKKGKDESGSPTQSGPVGSGSETVLDAGSVMCGEFRFAENVRLEGRVEGKVWAGKTVVVGEGAEVDASIEAETLEVFGTVVGDICVARSTTLHKTARVEGEIQTAGIVVEEGARFKGCIVIGEDDASPSGGYTGPAEPPRTAANEPPSLAETRDA